VGGSLDHRVVQVGWGGVQLPFRYTFIFSLIVSISNVGSTAGVNFIARRFEVADEVELRGKETPKEGRKGGRKCGMDRQSH